MCYMQLSQLGIEEDVFINEMSSVSDFHELISRENVYKSANIVRYLSFADNFLFQESCQLKMKCNINLILLQSKYE